MKPLIAFFVAILIASSLSCPPGERHRRSPQQWGWFNHLLVDRRPLFESRGEICLQASHDRSLSFPVDVCVNDSKFFISSWENPIRVFRPDGEFLFNVGSVGNGPGQYRTVGALFTVGGHRIGIYDPHNARLTVFTTAGKYVWSKSFNLPGVFSIRSIVYYQGRFYLHVPATEIHPYYLMITDDSLNIIHECIPASPDYKGYLYFGLFDGSVLIDSVRGKAYEVNSYSYKPTEIDLVTWQTRLIEYPKPSFFRPIPQYANVTDRSDSASSAFRQGTVVNKAFIVQERYLAIEFYDQHGPPTDVFYALLDLQTGRSYTGYNDFDTPNWSDGKYLYRMAQGPRLPFTQPDIHIVHDPYLIVYNLVEPPSK